jgi:hypothetical protein
MGAEIRQKWSSEKNKQKIPASAPCEPVQMIRARTRHRHDTVEAGYDPSRGTESCAGIGKCDMA